MKQHTKPLSLLIFLCVAISLTFIIKLCGSGGKEPLFMKLLSVQETLPHPWRYRLVARHPHDPTAFTEGFLFYNGSLFESTGRSGRSYVRLIDQVTNATASKTVALPQPYFGEGIAILNDTIYMLTYKALKGFKISLKDFTIQDKFDFHTSTGEGWGMTTDGKHFIVSDGSSTISFWDPETMKEVSNIKVKYQGEEVSQINELEYVNGEILANVWFQTYILRIDIKNGNVLEKIELDELTKLVENLKHLTGNDKYNAVMNGIAYNPSNQHLFITGKLWNTVFEIELPFISRLSNTKKRD